MADLNLSDRFRYHKPDELTASVHDEIREECLGLAKFLVETLPESREQSLAITKLEEAMFWANASIARNGLKYKGE